MPGHVDVIEGVGHLPQGGAQSSSRTLNPPIGLVPPVGTADDAVRDAVAGGLLPGGAGPVTHMLDERLGQLTRRQPHGFCRVAEPLNLLVAQARAGCGGDAGDQAPAYGRIPQRVAQHL